MKKKIVVFSGAGISAESGIQTFRDNGGLWENHKIEEVATFEAWIKNKELVLNFYNQRRKQIMNACPNDAHKMIAELEKTHEVQVITQNIDDLHERAGSSNVLHLHGEIMKARSTSNPQKIYSLNHWELKIGDLCEENSQLRPHIVWFGEAVPEMDKAYKLTETADIFITIGTSLNVYPAANLIHVAKPHITKFLIDPGDIKTSHIHNLTVIKSKAVDGMKILFQKLTELN
jgi:NAD-dependent deacetylase